MTNPSTEGWHWVWFANERNPRLFWIDKDGFKEHNKYPAGIAENWAYIKQQYNPSRFEYLGRALPQRIVPKQDGYYWITSGDGSRHIVRCKKRNYVDYSPVSITTWHAELMGSNMTHSWYSVVEAYQVLRIDFIAEADEDFCRSNLKS